MFWKLNEIILLADFLIINFYSRSNSMKTFIADIIPKIQRFSKKLDDLTRLTNQHWVSIGDIDEAKRVFIFRQNNQLLISENGNVEKGSWEYLGNQSLLIDTRNASYLLKHGFFDDNVIALKLDSTDSYAFFVNETKYDFELNNITDILRFLRNKYLNDSVANAVIGKQSPKNLNSKKLPPPNMWVEQMLIGDDILLIDTTINWRQFCESHSDYYPLYTYQELLKRGVSISNSLQIALEQYALSMGYNSFNNMKRDYFY